MPHRYVPTFFFMCAALHANACARSPIHADAPNSNVPPKSIEGQSMTAPRPVWVAKQYPTLDAYLAHLERESHVGGKWYREFKPGMYELVAGNLHLDKTSKEQRIFTRAELEQKFGFRQ